MSNFDTFKTSPAGLSSSARLKNELAQRGVKLTKNKLEKEMKHWETYTRFRRKYNKSKDRDRVLVYGPNDLWQADLAFLPKYRNIIGFLIA